MINKNNEIIDIGGKIDSLVDAFLVAGETPNEESLNQIDFDINQTLA